MTAPAPKRQERKAEGPPALPPDARDPASAADVIIRDIKAEVVEPASFVCEAAHLSPS